MEHAYPQLLTTDSLLVKVANNEEERFRETLEHGLALLDEEMERLAGGTEKAISGSFIFKLYDTFGFPFDIVRDISLEKGFDFDEEGFLGEMENQRTKSRQSRKGEGVRLLGEGVKSIAGDGKKASFTGYTELAGNSIVQALLNSEGSRVSQLSAGEKGQLFVDTTPFYAESGGQEGDSGTVSWEGGRAKVTTTAVEGDKIILHAVEVKEGTLSEKTEVQLTVTGSDRKATASHHTATHLLHAALREVLGDHVKQAGSLVGPGRLRFDFTHFSPVTPDELHQIELLVNQKIWENAPVATRLLDREEALKEGAMALFGEKYDEKVRVVSVSDFSKELCGGTHVSAVGEIGVFKIQSEGGIAAGVRRIEALAGNAAYKEIQGVYKEQKEAAELLNAQGMNDVAGKVEQLLAHVKDMENKVADLSKQLESSDLDSLFNDAIEIDGIKVVSAVIPLDSPKTLREVGDKVRDGLGSGVAVLGGAIGGKAAILALVSKDLTSKIKAGALVSKVAQVVGGKGGGRPDMAQAGGPMVDKLPEAIKAVPSAVKEILSQN